MLSNEDLSVDDVILPKESNAVLCQENIDKVEQMHHHSYENEGKQQTIQESPSFAATVKGSESGAREEDLYCLGDFLFYPLKSIWHKEPSITCLSCTQ